MSAAAIGGTAALTAVNAERFRAVWGKVPADRLAFFRAAEATIVAANGVLEPPPAGTTASGEVYWARGYADRLIASVEAACAFWRMSEVAYVAAVVRISRWFEENGWTHLKNQLEATLAYADRAHDAGESLRRAALDASRADRAARDGAERTTRRTTR